MDWSSVLPPIFFLAMVCLYWAFRALIWFVITPSTALESWVRITFLFIHCFQNTLYLVVHKLNEVISVIIELWRAWLRQTQLPCIADKCVEILVSTLSILDNINGTSGPPLPPITMMLKWHVFTPSRLSSLPFFGGGGRGRAQAHLWVTRTGNDEQSDPAGRSLVKRRLVSPLRFSISHSLPTFKPWRSRYESVNYGISNYWFT